MHAFLIYIAAAFGVAWIALFGAMIRYSLKPGDWDKLNKTIVLINLCTVIIGITLTAYCALEAHGLYEIGG